MKDVSIIIVSYNSSQYIVDCLTSVFIQTYKNFEVIIVDNCSTDGTVELIEKRFSNLYLIKNKENLGFGKAVNQGVEISKGDYIFVLNSDIVLRDNTVEHIAKGISQMPSNVGMISPKIMRMNKDIIDSTGLVLSNAIRFFDRGSGEKDVGQYDSMRDRDILGPCAAAGIYKRRMLEDIEIDGEYFDGDFFYLIEDFDLALRARRKGWSCRYVPAAVCYHTRNGSDTGYRYRQYLTFRNRYFFMIKNIRIRPYLIFYLIAYDIPRFIFMLFSNRHTLRALRELNKSFPRMLKKRRDLALVYDQGK